MSRRKNWLAGAVVLAVLAACAAPSVTEGNLQAAAECVTVRAPDLYGEWRLLWADAPAEVGQLRLSRHPEFSASLRGHFSYGGHRSIASGDVEQGRFMLDESRDGKTLFAFWAGVLVAGGGCSQEIRGRWEQLVPEGQPAVTRDFVLRRAQPVDAW